MQEEYFREEDLAKVGEDDRIDHIGLLSDKDGNTGNLVHGKIKCDIRSRT
jgi:hypothetical protein